MCVDAASSVIHAQQSAMAFEVGIAVAKKQLDATQAQGDAINQLLQSAAQLSKAIGKGDGLDLVG